MEKHSGTTLGCSSLAELEPDGERRGNAVATGMVSGLLFQLQSLQISEKRYFSIESN
jgi:hypothetical protein